jgi:hypothetical protein
VLRRDRSQLQRLLEGARFLEDEPARRRIETQPRRQHQRERPLVIVEAGDAACFLRRSHGARC